MRSCELIFHVALPQNLQPDRGYHVELGSEGLGHIVAVVVPLEGFPDEIRRVPVSYRKVIFTGVT